MTVDQHAAHIETLRHTHQRIVDRGIAVGVIFTQAVAHDAGTFAVGLIRRVAQFQHRVEDTALHRL